MNGQTTDVIARDANMVPQPKLDAAGKPVPYHVSYPWNDSIGNFLTHPNAKSVVGIHNFGWMFVQATVAILILVGFESVRRWVARPKTPSATSRSRSSRHCWFKEPSAICSSILPRTTS